MDAVRVARSCRALRIRRRWRQQDLADVAGVSRQLISKVESSDMRGVQISTLEQVAEALGASLDVNLRWRGEGLDRLLDAAHAALVEGVVDRLSRWGWECAVEVSFAIRGERGSIDVFALHRATASVLVTEVKSVVPDSQATIHLLDRKARVACLVASDRGWPCRNVGRLLVIGESTTARRRLASLGLTYRAAFPARGHDVTAWLRSPSGGMSGLLFLPFATAGGVRNPITGRQRIRKPKS